MTEDQRFFHKTILPLARVGRDGAYEPLGTCWIVGFSGKKALAITAAHVFEQAARQDNARVASAPSLPNVFGLRKYARDLPNTSVVALFGSDQEGFHVAEVMWFNAHEDADVAICLLRLPSATVSPISFTDKISIFSGPFFAGTPIVAVGCNEMWKTHAKSISGDAIEYSHHHSLVFRHGICREYYPTHAPRGPKGPSFDTDIVADHGMSGGPIFFKDTRRGRVACGLISRGSNFADQSTAASLWPIYGLEIKSALSGNDTAASLLDLAKAGHIDDRAAPGTHISVSSDSGTMSWNGWPPGASLWDASSKGEG